MPAKRPESYLFDILEAAWKIQRFIAGYNAGRFLQDEKTISAVERQFMIIGEAAKHVAPSLRERFPEIDFRLAAAMRNFIVHQYDEVDARKVWRTVTEDLPGVVHVLEPFIAERLKREQQREPPGFER